MAVNPVALLREAIRAVPAVKYALGVAGLIAVVAIVRTFGLDPAVAVSGAIVTLVLMVALLIFARLTATASSHFILPALVFTWGSLVLVLASAGMLFTSAFFDWPIRLGGTAPSPVPERPDAEIGNETPRPTDPATIAASAAQLESRDYPTAWWTVTAALQDQPASDDLLDLQADVAMAWVRDAKHGEDQTFADVVDPLLPALYRAAHGSRKPQDAADALAHIGWANFLKNRAGGGDLDAEAKYREALAVDPENPFAHAMWGHWLLTHRGPAGEARAHFAAAIESSRERDFVNRFQIAALQWFSSSDNSIELIRVCNQIRQRGESLPEQTRSRLLSGIYYTDRREILAGLATILPADQHLATFRWLLQGFDVQGPNASNVNRFFLARLSEAAGDCETALSIYTSLPEMTTEWQAEIEHGIDRCRA